MGDAGIFHGEHLLILSFATWPDAWLDNIRRRFPRLEITSLQIDTSQPVEENVPKGQYHPIYFHACMQWC
jgi:hypothetical protein